MQSLSFQSIIEYLAGGIIAFALGLSFTIFDMVPPPFQVPLFVLMSLPFIPFGISFMLFALGNRRMGYGAFIVSILNILVIWRFILPQ